MFCYVKRRPGIKPLFPARRVCTAANPALRYLLFALLGSILYLFGRVLFYGAYGTLDIVMLSGRVQAQPVTWAAVALIRQGCWLRLRFTRFSCGCRPRTRALRRR
jgi:hypothetical protein